jgi:hypothetical protein
MKAAIRTSRSICNYGLAKKTFAANAPLCKCVNVRNADFAVVTVFGENVRFTSTDRMKSDKVV